jgi:hypothetical protein
VRRSILVLPKKIIRFWQRPDDTDGSHIPVHPDDALDELECEERRVGHDRRPYDLLLCLWFQLAHQGTKLPYQSGDCSYLNYLDVRKIKQEIELLLLETTSHVFFECHPVHVWNLGGVEDKVKGSVRPKFSVEHFCSLISGCI